MAIVKVTHTNPEAPPLIQLAVPDLDVSATNRLQAVCTDDPTRNAVHLAFTVNGRSVQVTDTTDPLRSGTVAIVAATAYGDTRNSVEVEFDNVVATRR